VKENGVGLNQLFINVQQECFAVIRSPIHVNSTVKRTVMTLQVQWLMIPKQ